MFAVGYVLYNSPDNRISMSARWRGSRCRFASHDEPGPYHLRSYLSQRRDQQLVLEQEHTADSIRPGTSQLFVAEWPSTGGGNNGTPVKLLDSTASTTAPTASAYRGGRKQIVRSVVLRPLLVETEGSHGTQIGDHDATRH